MGWVKATEAVKPWEEQPPRTLRRRGRGMQGQSIGELERPSWDDRERRTLRWDLTQRESEPGIVPSVGGGQHNPHRGKARQPDHATKGGPFGECHRD